MGNNKNIAHNEPCNNKAKNSNIVLILAFLAIIFLQVSTISASTNEVQTLIKSSCSSTLYPDLCISSLLSSEPLEASSSTIKNPADVIKAIIKVTIKNVKLNKIIIKKIAARKALTIRCKSALKDCVETLEDTIDELKKVVLDLKTYPSSKITKEDLMILLSAARTNQETCSDGFSHDESDKKVRSEFLGKQIQVSQLCSNTLAMIKNMTGTSNVETNEEFMQERRLEEHEDGNSGLQWPKWLSAGDRRLLQTTVTPDVTVAADGSGNYRTVSEAVAAAPSGSTRRYVIRIKAGVYRENVEVAKAKTNLMFVGDGRSNTIITASRNVVDGSTTFNSATVAIIGQGFLARDITFQNSAGPSKHQAVALRVNADLTAFYRCGMIAYQDTLYVHSLRQFYISCFISGTVDFIFGNAAVVLQDCDIHARRPGPSQKNMVTAQGRDDPNENTGIVIQKCRIGATADLQGLQSTFPTYLGRPWKEYSRTIVMQSVISDVIHPAGWFEWDGNFALNTLFYGEYQNTGAGASTSNRVKWNGFKVITSSSEAQAYTPGNFISGGNWLGATGFPFSLGL